VPERSPSVLLVAEQLRRRVPGGIGTHARGLLAGLGQLAAEDVPALTLYASRPPRRDDGDPLARFGWPLRTSQLPSRVLTRGWDHGLVPAPAGFEVVHSVSTAAPRVRRASGSAEVVTIHDLAWRRNPEATTRRGRRWHEAALARARHAAAAIVVPSQLVAADLESAGVDAGRITVVISGADHLPPPDPAAGAAVLQRLAVRGEFLLTVGTLEPRKNLDRLVAAYRTVRGGLPEAWPLVVVGPAGWGPRPTVSADEGVVLAGLVDAPALADLYRRARAFAYTPLAEGYGLPPLEAMGVGTPAVVSRWVPSVHDLGAIGPAPARIVDPLDVDDIAAGLAAVLTDDALRRDLAARGEVHARSRTWRRAAQGHVSLWRLLV
jgi:glycosyltransferase involved in cell wall biosynthesis